jgi:T5SS/PEP-CTERM-associated repeat protein
LPVLLAVSATALKSVHAAVSAVGDVSPAPPAGGGNVAAPFRVGISGPGTLIMSNGTPLTVTGGSAVFGDGATGVGIVQIDGLGTNFSAANLTIGNSGSGSVTLGSGSSGSFLSRITLTGDLILADNSESAGDLFINGLGTIVDVGDDVTVGDGGAALVQLTSGGRLLADAANLGQTAGGDGRVTVSGHQSLWRQDNTLTIGDGGRGELQVVSQGRVESAGTILGSSASGEGVAVVSGAASTWEIAGALDVASGGNALLNVLEGARVTNSQIARIGVAPGSEGHAVVSGANSLWASGGTLTVGNGGFGTLDVRNGGRVTSLGVVLGDNAAARGEVVVDGGGSTWEITGTLDVSDPGEARFTISNGGLVTTTGVTRIAAAGRLTLAGGRLDVAAAGGLTNNGLLEGGGRIGGLVTNTATGKLRTRFGDVLVLANNLVNSGLVDLTAGELETLGTLTNNNDIDARNATLRGGGTGLDNNSGAQLAITSGTVDVYGAVDNNAGGQIVIGGGATGVFHDNVTNNGAFFVMQGADALVLENLSFMPTASLNLQLGLADEADELGQVEVAGLATLAGALSVSLATGYMPGAGDTFQLLTATGGLTGTFAAQSLPGLGGGLSWDVAYSATGLTLSVVPGLTADFDQDGDVDSMDLAAWKGGFGTGASAGKEDGDADGDGDVDGSDFLAWQRELGSDSSATPAASAAPEPSGGALAAAASMLAPSRRRWRHVARGRNSSDS